MNNRMNKVTVLNGCLSFFLILFSSTLFAATRANSVAFTLGGGYEYFSSKHEVKNTGVGFGALGYNFTDHWGIEGLVGFFNTKSQRVATYHEQVKGTLFAIDGLYHFSSFQVVEPYLLAGVGVMGMNPSGDDAHNEGNINAGVGVQWFANQVVALRVEARDFYTWVGGKNDVMLDAGVMFLLDLC